MSLQMFDHAFPGFSDLETPQPYDDAPGAEAALRGFEADVLAALGEGRLATDDGATRAVQLSALEDHMRATVTIWVAAMMPPELATESSDFTVEQAQGARLPLEEQLPRLEGGDVPPEDAAVYYRLLNTTLEQSYQALLDHLTAARVAEEMDTPTYIERLRGAVGRVREGSRAQAARLEPHIATAQVVAARLAIATSVLRFLRAQAVPRLADTAPGDGADLDAALARLEGFVANARRFADHFRRFLDLSHASLTRLRRDFASQANMAGAEGEATLVSREIERHAFFRPLPLVWALAITLLVKIVLAHNSSETLHYLAIPILVGSFVLTWSLSIFIGVRARVNRMKEVQAHTRQQMRHVLMLDDTDDELIEFPHIAPDHEAPRPKRLAPFAYRGHAFRHKRAVMRRNLLALAIPAVLGAVVLIARDRAGHDFIARFSGQGPCILASGRMVFATPRSYFVQPGGGDSGPFAWALKRVFPELLAEVVDRSAVIRVTRGLHPPEPGNGARGLRDCLSDDPAQKEAGQGQAAAVTVDLGHTSLEILTQAVMAGATPAPRLADPIMLKARQSIAIALSNPDPARIDVAAILAALNTVRGHLGGDISMAQALEIVFAGAGPATSRLDLPDHMLAFFDGADGAGGLIHELRELRLALADGTRLGATLAAQLTGDRSGAALVTLLDDKLSALIAQQGALGLALGQWPVPSGAAPAALIVTPAIRVPPDGDAPAGVNAHIFQTSITLPGGDEAAVQGLQNALVLPFFTTPVRSGETPQGAFDWGADTANLTDPVVTPDGVSYFARIAETLESCLVGNATVQIDMIGLASPSWDGPSGTAAPDRLNYYLAEGRRLGAMRRLGELMDAAALPRVLVTLADGTHAPMTQLIDASAAAGTLESFLPRFGRFTDTADFERRRDTLLGITGLSPDIESPLEELFARSVVLRMVRSDAGPCAF